MKTNHETPILGFYSFSRGHLFLFHRMMTPVRHTFLLIAKVSSRRQNGIHFVGLLFPTCNRMDAWA